MSVAISPSEGPARPPKHASAALGSLRASGLVALDCAFADGRTRIVDMTEAGGYRLKFPDRGGHALDAAVLNTGGGVAGGDRVRIAVNARENADVAISTATAERIYRSPEPVTEIDISLHAAQGARIRWLPQPSILFSGARLMRRIDADISATTKLLIAEATVFGRTESGEIMGPGLFRESWRIRRDGRLIFAEETKLDGHVGQRLARPAVSAGASVVMLLLYTAPDAEDLREPLRAALRGFSTELGVSAWRGMLVLRLLAHRMEDAQRIVRLASELLTRSPAPSVWQC